MRIVIDIQGAQSESRFRGIGRYTLSLSKAIARIRGDHELFLVLNGMLPDTIESIRAAFDNLLPQENILVWIAPGPVRESDSENKPRRKVAEIIREAFICGLDPDIIHISSLFEGYVDDAVTSIGRLNKNIPVTVSLYDLIPLLNPAQYLEQNLSHKRYYMSKIDQLRKADCMLAISESSRQEALLKLGIAESTIINVSSAADTCFRQVDIDKHQAENLLKKYDIQRPFVFYTGAADDRKNIPGLIKAYAGLPNFLRHTHQLVLAGRIPDYQLYHLRSEAKHSGLGRGELKILGYIPDDELVYLYNLCKVYVFPTWHEGFGLPALEAMACGAAVIGSNKSSLPEVIGRNDALFNPFIVDDISFKMRKVLEDERFRADLSAHGIVQAGKFRWEESSRRAINAFESLHVTRTTRRSVKHHLPEVIKTIAQNVIAESISDAEMIKIAHALSRIQPGDAPRQILVDISELVQRDAHTGIQRVTRSILKELIERPPKQFVIKPVYSSIDSHGYHYAHRFMAKILKTAKADKDEPIEYHSGDIFLGLDLQSNITIMRESYLSQMRNEGVKIYFLIYDLLPVLFPHYWPTEHNKVHHQWLNVVSKFDGAICISRAVSDELSAWLRINGGQRLRPFKVMWFHLGADLKNSFPTVGLPAKAKYILQTLRQRPTFLNVGTIEPRKGQAQILGAFELLWQQGHDLNLVIVGKEGWMVEKLVKRMLSHPQNGNRLFWLEGISDEFLEKVYEIATCLISASEGEGFGLPLIEAARYKIPIIARDIPVFREVAGDHAAYFEGTEPECLANIIISWLKMLPDESYPKSDELPWITWRESTDQLLRNILG